ncbi:hypothetical protein [uncultured Shimia sp.]|uniref:hypothetical protein n=1 Tax=uncultured Shimia sp. TaxID=573152 RepID=UPI0026242749|nr:hypothetical protein [uncultured Shimia sp.]
MTYRVSLLTLGLLAMSGPTLAQELKGPDLLSTISGQHFDCKMGPVPLEWIISEVDPEASVVPYNAIVGGKTVEAEYTLTEDGKLSSDGYGDARTVTPSEDGTLSVARSDGRVMVCTQR